MDIWQEQLIKLLKLLRSPKKQKTNFIKFVVEKGTFCANDILIGALYLKENSNRKETKGILEAEKIHTSLLN